MKTFLDRFKDKAKHQKNDVSATEQGQAHAEITGEVDHLWMKEDLDAKKPKLEKDPRIDTGILRSRIADKLAKTNNF